MDEDTTSSVLTEAILEQTMTGLGLVGRHLSDTKFVVSVSVSTMPARRTTVGLLHEGSTKLSFVITPGIEEILLLSGSTAGRHDVQSR